MPISPINQINQYNKNNKYNTKQKNKQSSFVTFGMSINKPNPKLELAGKEFIEKLQDNLQERFNKTLNAKQIKGIEEILEKAGIKISQEFAKQIDIDVQPEINSKPIITPTSNVQEKYNELASDKELIFNDKKLNELYTTIDSMENVETPMILKLGVKTIADTYNNSIKAIPITSNDIANQEKRNLEKNIKEVMPKILSTWLNFHNTQLELPNEIRETRKLLLRKLVFDKKLINNINWSKDFLELISKINNQESGALMGMSADLFFENEQINKKTNLKYWLSDIIFNQNYNDKSLIQCKIKLFDKIFSTPQLKNDENLIQIFMNFKDRAITPTKIITMNNNLNVLEKNFDKKYASYIIEGFVKSIKYIESSQCDTIGTSPDNITITSLSEDILRARMEDILDFIKSSNVIDNKNIIEALKKIIISDYGSRYSARLNFIKAINNSGYSQNLNFSNILKTINDEQDCNTVINIYRNFKNKFNINQDIFEFILNNARDYTYNNVYKIHDFPSVGICDKSSLDNILKSINVCINAVTEYEGQDCSSERLPLINCVKNILLKLMLLDKNTIEKGLSKNFSELLGILDLSIVYKYKMYDIEATSNILNQLYDNPEMCDNIQKHNYFSSMFMQSFNNSIKQYKSIWGTKYKASAPSKVNEEMLAVVSTKLQTEKNLKNIVQNEQTNFDEIMDITEKRKNEKVSYILDKIVNNPQLLAKAQADKEFYSNLVKASNSLIYRQKFKLKYLT